MFEKTGKNLEIIILFTQGKGQSGHACVGILKGVFAVGKMVMWHFSVGVTDFVVKEYFFNRGVYFLDKFDRIKNGVKIGNNEMLKYTY